MSKEKTGSKSGANSAHQANSAPQSDEPESFYTPSSDQPDQFSDTGFGVYVTPDNKPDEIAEWQASEFAHTQKDLMWYVVYSVFSLVILVLLYLMTKDIFSLIAMVVLLVAVGIFANRKPRTLNYKLDHSAVYIDGKPYILDDFRSFSIERSGNIYSLTFMPMKRFMVPLTIYFAEQDSKQITDIVSSVMPYEERNPDFVERLLRNIRY